MAHDEGLWFIREGEEQGSLGKWEVWFRPVRGQERRHGTFQLEAQAVEVAHTLNELSRHSPAGNAHADSDAVETDAEQGHA